MNAEILERAVTEDKTGVLSEVVKASYALVPVDKLSIMNIAERTNKVLGYKLFTDLYYPRLILDFARVARAVQANAMNSK